MIMKQLITLLFLFAASLTVPAQNVLGAAGGDAKSEAGSVSSSIGQVFYQSQSGSGGSASEGVQQAYKIIVTGGADQKHIQLAMQTYPNPTTDILTLGIPSMESSEDKSLWCSLFDAKGKRLQYQRIEHSKTVINMKQHVPGFYFLRVEQHGKDTNQAIKIFKIIKN